MLTSDITSVGAGFGGLVDSYATEKSELVFSRGLQVFSICYCAGNVNFVG